MGVVAVLQFSIWVFKLRGLEVYPGYSPLVIRTAVRGAVVAGHRWEPCGVVLDWGP